MITSRKILNGIKELGIYLESESLEPLLDNNEDSLQRILRYSDSSNFNFYRTPFESKHEELRKISVLDWQYMNESDVYSVNKEDGDFFTLSYTKETILNYAKQRYNKEKITKNEFNKILSIFTQGELNQYSPHIYITAADFILKRRYWFESNFPRLTLNIMTTKEAQLFLDLYLKYNNIFSADSHYSFNEGLWYWNSMRLKLPHYNVDMENPIINALADRFVFALMALDKMGIQYFLGVNNDTARNTLYHFYYLITLITGIFDNLALLTDKRLNINFQPIDRIS